MNAAFRSPPSRRRSRSSFLLVGLLTVIAGALLAAPRPSRAADDPDTEVAKRLFREGADLYAAGDYQKALEKFQLARVAKPLSAFDFNMARCYDRLGRWTDALAAYEKFAATTSDAADVKEAQDRIPILRKRVKETSDRAAGEEHYRKAINHFNGNEYASAAAEFKFAYQATSDPMLLYNIAQAYRLGGDAHNATDYYDQFLRSAPASPLRATVELRVAELKGKAAPTGKPGSIAGTPGKGKTPVAAKPPVMPPPSAKPGGSERLTPIADIIKNNRAGFRSCFDAWSEKHPNIPGKVTLSFYLDPDGILNQAEVQTRGFEAPEVGDCIVSHARTLSYPAAPNGKYTRFNYPFDFKPN